MIGTVALLALALGGTYYAFSTRAPQPERTLVSVTPTPDRLSGQLRQGQVAFSVQLDPSVGSGAVIRAGDRVDLLAYFPPQVTGGEGVTRTLVRDATVLVARQQDSGVTTLSVSSEQALLLQHAAELGGRRFAFLRSPQETALSALPDIFTDRDLDVWMAKATGSR
jgi:Flp pilus assembly protein CpaB